MKKFKLLPHQKEGLRRALEEPFFFLFMDPGTGKTAIAIKEIEERYRRGEIFRVLIFVPNSIKYNWELEIERFLKLKPQDYRVHRIEGKAKKRNISFFTSILQEIKRNPHRLNITIVNFEKATLMEKALITYKPDMLIVDELHKLKNPNAKMSKAIYRITQRCSYRLGLTGTPVCKGYEDLFMQYKIIDPEIFGRNYRDFEREYILKGGYMGHNIVGYQNTSQLKRIVRSTSYRVKIEDLGKLPPLQINHVGVRLSPRTEKIYSEMSEDMYTTLEVEVSRSRLKKILRENNIPYKSSESYYSLLIKAQPFINVASCDLAITKLLRLHQIAGGFLTLDSGEVEFLGSDKWEILLELLDESSPNLIFCQYVPEVEYLTRELRKEFPGKRVENYQDIRKRDAIYRDFQEGEIDILIMQIASGSVGLNLQRSHNLIFYSWSFSYDNFIQAIARIKRQGQIHPMRVTLIVALDTIDEDILHSQEHKRILSQQLLE